MRQAIRERVLIGQDRDGTSRLPAQWADSRIAWREVNAGRKAERKPGRKP